MQIEVIIEKKSHKLDAEEGKTILETLQEHGIHVLTAPCGGRGRCGKCTVEVEHMGEVLACMTKVTDGMRITIPYVYRSAIRKSQLLSGILFSKEFLRHKRRHPDGNTRNSREQMTHYRISHHGKTLNLSCLA